MIQQSHSWANIQRKLLFKKIHATNIHSRTAYSEVILMFTDQQIDKEDVVNTSHLSDSWFSTELVITKDFFNLWKCS